MPLASSCWSSRVWRHWAGCKSRFRAPVVSSHWTLDSFRTPSSRAFGRALSRCRSCRRHADHRAGSGRPRHRCIGFRAVPDASNPPAPNTELVPDDAVQVIALNAELAPDVDGINVPNAKLGRGADGLLAVELVPAARVVALAGEFVPGVVTLWVPDLAVEVFVAVWVAGLASSWPLQIAPAAPSFASHAASAMLQRRASLACSSSSRVAANALLEAVLAIHSASTLKQRKDAFHLRQASGGSSWPASAAANTGATITGRCATSPREVLKASAACRPFTSEASLSQRSHTWHLRWI